MLIELNTRVDIIMIGIFMSDEKVGIYSFAALFAEGFYQLLIVLQNIMNPIMARQFSNSKLNEFYEQCMPLIEIVENDNLDESKNSKKIAQSLGLDHNELIIKESDLVITIPKMANKIITPSMLESFSFSGLIINLRYRATSSPSPAIR